MNVGILRIQLHLPDNGSLKGKRQVVSGLLRQVRSQFGVAAAEVGDGDLWQLADLAIACVSNDARHTDQVMAGVARFVEQRAGDAMVASVRTEILKLP
ncbi:MAG: DUF503 domain-containing protein [Chloroflexi bacterium]|nr:MAG: DUF503 domain-containing protein [Chloroflexota bacterium]TME16266.1 MAG: DUF503 domain-containing protein [Chloroflexota bacterium]TME16639.1 MAG: DUF503 domain-containing protein [Chloroflexota bacterium]